MGSSKPQSGPAPARKLPGHQLIDVEKPIEQARHHHRRRRRLLGQVAQCRRHQIVIAGLVLMQDTRDTQFASPFGADELFHARVRPRQEQRRLIEKISQNVL